MYDNINANQILAYVTRHSLRERAFPGWQNEQILMFTLEHMRDDTILVATFQGQIVGILAYDDEQPDNRIMVQTILTSAPGILAMFIGVWKQRCPEAVIVARRHGRRIQYTSRALLRHLERTFTKEINHTPSTVNYATA